MTDKQRIKIISPYLWASALCLASVALMPIGLFTTGVFGIGAVVAAIEAQVTWNVLKRMK